MKGTCRVAFALLAVLAAGRLAADDKPADPMAALERFVGEFTVNGKWSDGKGLQARSVCEWGLGKKILKARTFVMDGDREYQRYESIMAWHPEKKCLYEISFAFDGNLSEYRLDPKDRDTLHVGFSPVPGGKDSNVRQIITFLDNDSYRWVILIKQGDKWEQIMDAVWKRKK